MAFRKAVASGRSLPLCQTTSKMTGRLGAVVRIVDGAQPKRAYAFAYAYAYAFWATRV